MTDEPAPKRIALVMALGPDDELGLRGGLPWPRLVEDLLHFRRLTMGRDVVVGAGTYRTMPPLPGRNVHVLSRTPGQLGLPTRTFRSIGEAVAFAAGPTVYVIGGAQAYEAALPIADEVWLTRVHIEGLRADVRFKPRSWGRWKVGTPPRGVGEVTIHHLVRP